MKMKLKTPTTEQNDNSNLKKSKFSSKTIANSL